LSDAGKAETRESLLPSELRRGLFVTVWDPKETLDAIGAGEKKGRKRSARVAEAIRNEIATLLIGKVSDPSLQGVSITRVEVSDDLSDAKIYYSLYGEGKDLEAVAAGFRRAAGFMRSHIARTLDLRYTPALQFRYDKTMDKVFELEEIFQEIADERKSSRDDS
jgi:ribosome-binding factor A